MEAQAIFLHPFTICSSCTRKFVVFPFIDEETNRSYPFANGLNGKREIEDKNKQNKRERERERKL
jgi:hypothetical protein